MKGRRILEISNGSNTKVSSLKSRQLGRWIFILTGLVPVLVWFFIFMLYPIILSIRNSFYNTNLAYNSDNFIGLDNFKRLLVDPNFIVALKNTLLAVVYIVPPVIVLSFIVALLLNAFNNKIREAFTMIYFLPVVTSMVAISIVWKWLYDPTYGLFNYVLSILGLPQLQYIFSPTQALPSLCAIEVWKAIGYYAVLLLAALRTIPVSYFEAAKIDGAESLQTLRFITLPMLKPTFLFILIMNTIEAFKIFIPVKVITDGGPGNSTKVLVLQIIDEGIKNMDIGYASAMSIVMLLVIGLITIIQWKIAGKDM